MSKPSKIHIIPMQRIASKHLTKVAEDLSFPRSDFKAKVHICSEPQALQALTPDHLVQPFNPNPEQHASHGEGSRWRHGAFCPRGITFTGGPGTGSTDVERPATAFFYLGWMRLGLQTCRLYGCLPGPVRCFRELCIHSQRAQARTMQALVYVLQWDP